MDNDVSDMQEAELVSPWNNGVRGDQVLPLINADAAVFRVPSGPGTGKTFGLTRRVLRLLHPEGLNTPPNRVLVCTFNRVIARELKQQIEVVLQPYGLEVPQVVTVHALCASIAAASPRFLLPQEIEAMVYDIREKNPSMEIEYAGGQRNALRALREHEAGLKDYPFLGAASREWQTAHLASLIGDLPRRILLGIEGGDYDETRYDHIIVDEFQDLTSIEVRLLLALRSASCQFVALGDRKQSIYAFRGIDGEGMDQLVFEGLTPVDHVMSQCQRCPENIVALANEVAASYGEGMVAINDVQGVIARVHHDTPKKEHSSMAKAIAYSVNSHPESKHLVLTTRRKWGYDLRNAIREVDANISVQTVFSEDILETWPAREAFMFLSIVGRPDDPAALRDWIAYQEPDDDGANWKAQKRNAEVYVGLLEEYGPLTLELVRTVRDVGLDSLKGTGKSKVYRRIVRLFELLEQLPGGDAVEVTDWVLDPDRWCRWDNPMKALASEDIRRLKEESLEIIGSLGDAATIGELVDRLRYRISTREPFGSSGEPDVKIVTLWGAKGLTADFVYIVGLCDEALPGPHRQEDSRLSAAEHEQEQLRLLYVSLTRAKQGLVISRSKKILRGQVRALGLSVTGNEQGYFQVLKACRFFEDVSWGRLPTSIDGNAWAGFN